MKKYLIYFLPVTAMILLFSCSPPGGGLEKGGPDLDIITITDMNTYYFVEIVPGSDSHYETGRDYAREIFRVIPNWEALVDSYIADIIDLTGINPVLIYGELINRVHEIKNQIPAAYRDELNGFASLLTNSANNLRNDGKVSKDELYLVNLLPDVARISQCSAVSVFGELSATGSTITGRNLDWFSGNNNQLAGIPAVAVIKDGSRSVCLIGYLGFMAVISAFNDDGVFAAILDSLTGGVYSATNKRSYSFDLRSALENYSSLDVAAV